jgi:hypothetical protein
MAEAALYLAPLVRSRPSSMSTSIVAILMAAQPTGVSGFSVHAVG